MTPKRPREPNQLHSLVRERYRLINQAISPDVFFQTGPLDSWNKNGTMFFLCSKRQEAGMLKVFVEEAAALASITLFVGMIAVWAQLIPQL
jgi:hypothetical protein